jgi:two-component system, LuxR family, response regulator FixJ
MRDRPVVFLVDVDLETRKDLIAPLESAGLRLESFKSIDEFLAQYTGNEVGCVLFNWRPGDMHSAMLLQRLQDSENRIPLIVTIQIRDITVMADCTWLGRLALLHESHAPQAYISTIQATLESTKLLHLRTAGLTDARTRLSHLTPREREILQMLMDGKSTKKIAAELRLSTKTVENHRSHILAKSGAQNAADLVRLAMVAGITQAAI